jgi:hypothetical protein
LSGCVEKVVRTVLASSSAVSASASASAAAVVPVLVCFTLAEEGTGGGAASRHVGVVSAAVEGAVRELLA